MSSRRSFVKQSTLAAAAVVAINPIRSFAGISTSVYDGNISPARSLTIIHTGDLGGQFAPIADGSPYEGLGGFKSIKEAVQTIRKERKQVILLDAGQMNESLFKHAAELKYDGIVQSASDKSIHQAVQDYQLPVISHHPAGITAGAAPYRIIQKGPIRVGIISSYIEVGTANPLLHADKIATQLKHEKGCQLVICLSNLGLNRAKRLNEYTLANHSSDIDVVIGSGSGVVMHAPTIIFNRHKQEVITNHAGFGGLVLGKIDIQFNEEGNKIGVDFQNLVMGNSGHRWDGLPSSERSLMA